MKRTENLHIRIDKDLKDYLDILEKRYLINRSHFIRDAIIEKMKRDVKSLRVDREKRIKLSECPF